MPSSIINVGIRDTKELKTSRRGLVKGVLAGVAAATASAPTVAAASGDIPQLTDKERLDACLDEIRDVLCRMFPGVSVHHPHYLDKREDGSYRLTIQGDVSFQDFDGDGVYLVSRDGYVSEYLVRECPVVTLSGKHLGYSFYRGRARLDGGGWDDDEVTVLNFIRKIDGIPANSIDRLSEVSLT